MAPDLDDRLRADVGLDLLPVAVVPARWGRRRRVSVGARAGRRSGKIDAPPPRGARARGKFESSSERGRSGRGAGRARAVGSSGFETIVRASRARDGPRSGVETGKDSRSRKTLLPIERGGIHPRAVRAGTRGLMRFPTKRRVSPRAVLRSPSLTLNIFSLLVSPDPPAGASPRLDARTTAARRARRRDEPRARFSLGRHPCRPDRGARAARGEHATRPLALAVVVAVDVIVVVVVAAEHADPLSPVCLAPRAVRRTGAVVVGGRSRSLAPASSPLDASRFKKTQCARGEPIGFAEKRAPNDLAAENFWPNFLVWQPGKSPPSSDHQNGQRFPSCWDLTSASVNDITTTQDELVRSATCIQDDEKEPPKPARFFGSSGAVFRARQFARRDGDDRHPAISVRRRWSIRTRTRRGPPRDSERGPN